MQKNEVIVDTCFLEKLSSEGKKIGNIEKILSELEFIPVVHPYIYEHELSLKSYLKELVDEGYIRLVNYTEFLVDECGKRQYEDYFEMLYEELRQMLEANNSPKHMKPLNLQKGQTIYNVHGQGGNLGDVHLILMASFLQIPVILSQDSDIEILRSIVRRRMTCRAFSVTIYDALDLIKEVAKKEEVSMSKKELEGILNDIGARKYRAEITQLWNEHHSGT